MLTVHGGPLGRKDLVEATLGQRLKQARELAELGQADAATALLEPMADGSYRYQTISEWERGVRAPSIPELILACELYGVSADWLLLGKGDPRPITDEESRRIIAEIRRLLEPGRAPGEAAAKGGRAAKAAARARQPPASGARGGRNP